MSEANGANFYERYVSLCVNAGKTPSRVALEVGFSKSLVSRWKSGGEPTDATVIKIANYFGITSEELLAPVKPTQEKENETMSEVKVLPREKLQELLDVTREIFSDRYCILTDEEELQVLYNRRFALTELLCSIVGIGRTSMGGLVDVLVSYGGLKRGATPEDVVLVLNQFGWNVRLSE